MVNVALLVSWITCISYFLREKMILVLKFVQMYSEFGFSVSILIRTECVSVCLCACNFRAAKSRKRLELRDWFFR